MCKIRILYCGLSSALGGIEIYSRKIFDIIDRGKFDLSFISFVNNPCYKEYFEANGAKVYYIIPRKFILRHFFQLYSLFKKEQFDILHLHVNTMSYVEIVFIALIFRCKVIIHSRSSSNTGGKTTAILHFFYRMLLSKVSLTRLAVSNDAGKWAFGKKTFDIYYNGVDVDRFSYSIEYRRSIRGKYGILSSDILLGHVGRMSYPKNQKFILNFFSTLANINSNYKLMLVGDGDDESELRAYAKLKEIDDKVFFVGRQNNIPAFYSAFDIFVFPSFFEGYGNVILETQVAGLPCLVSEAISNEVIIRNNVLKLFLEEKLWCDAIMSLKLTEENEKLVAKDSITNSEYDIKCEIEKLQKLYIKLHNQ